MNKLFIACTALVFFIVTLEICATPSTQVWIPSTDIQPYKKLHIGWDAYIGTASGGTAGVISNGGLTIGVLPFSKVGLEVGVDYRDGSGNHRNPLYFNAKLGIPEGVFFKNMPAVAIGSYDFGTKKDITTYNIFYGLISKNIWKLGRFSLGGFKGGVGLNNPDILFGNSDAGVLVSWDRVISEISDKLWLGIDFQSGKSSYGALNFGAGWNFAPNVGMILGYDIFNDHKNFKPTVTYQIDVNVF
ncbi:MAG TPA: hypothetical protein VHP36_07210 [Chitinispirillaceae bacterium]|nr:hypothetical protein [Chitinispirillaceae bacterium]